VSYGCSNSRDEGLGLKRKSKFFLPRVRFYFMCEIFISHNIVNKMTEVTRTVNNVNDLSVAQSDISSLQANVNNNTTNISSLQENVNNNTTSISTLQSYTVSNGSNFGVGPGVFNQLTIGVQNVAVGNLSAVEYSVTNGSGNVMIGYNSGANCQSGNNNTFLGAYAQFESGKTLISSPLQQSRKLNRENIPKYSKRNCHVFLTILQFTGDQQQRNLRTPHPSH